MEDTASNFAKQLLISRGLKQTTSRISIIASIKSYEGAIPYSVLQDVVKADRSTLYRTLNILIDEGLIHKAKSTSQETYYAVCGKECSSKAHIHQHIHFQCKTCHKVSCEQLKEDIALSLPNHLIESIDITIQGVCRGCL